MMPSGMALRPLLPETRLTVCSVCAEHVKRSDDACPHCGTVLGGRTGLFARAAGVALVAGVMLASCSDKENSTTEDQALYGVVSSGFDTTSDTTGEVASSGSTEGTTDAPTSTDASTTDASTTDASTTTETGETTETTSDGSSSGGDQPEYGVPDTRGEQDYGVPDTD